MCCGRISHNFGKSYIYLAKPQHNSQFTFLSNSGYAHRYVWQATSNISRKFVPSPQRKKLRIHRMILPCSASSSSRLRIRIWDRIRCLSPVKALLLLIQASTFPRIFSFFFSILRRFLQVTASERVISCMDGGKRKVQTSLLLGSKFLNVAVVKFCNQAAANFRNFVRKEIG